MGHDCAHCHDEAVNRQLPIAVVIFIVLHLSTYEEHQVVLLVNSLALKGILMIDDFLIKNTVTMFLIFLHLLWV